MTYKYVDAKNANKLYIEEIYCAVKGDLYKIKKTGQCKNFFW